MKRTTFLNFLMGRDDPIRLTSKEKRDVARSQINKITGSLHQELGWKERFGIVIILALLILGIIFYLVFFPFGICLKLIGKDPMMRKLNREEEKSYRIPSSPKNIELMKEPY